MSKLTREEWAAGVALYRQAARKRAAQDLQNVTLKLNRFVGESFYLTGQVQSAYAGDAGRSRRVLGAGAQTHLGERLLIGANCSPAQAAVARGHRRRRHRAADAYVGIDLTRSLSLRLGGAGEVGERRARQHGGGLALAFTFGVASRP